MANPPKNYTVLSGGVGGAKLVLGLQQALAGNQFQVIANTGDDFEHLGLPICPDIDTLVYTLAGIVNPETGWGQADESWNFMESLDLLGGETWFRLGDRDLATHIRRRELLASGQKLSEATTHLRQALQVKTPIWPMSNDPVRTLIKTDDGTLSFQDYFVRQQAKPAVRAIHYAGSGKAGPSDEALAALGATSLGAIIITPSNPWLSIDPILSLSDIKTRIVETTVPVIAISPIVGGKAIKGPTAKIMHELGLEPSALNIAKHYQGIVDGLIIDKQDTIHRSTIEALGIAVKVTDTVMRNLKDKATLANDVIRFADSLSAGVSP